MNRKWPFVFFCVKRFRFPCLESPYTLLYQYKLQSTDKVMKITPRLVAEAPNIINPEGKLTLVLRNQNIEYIDNLRSCEDTFSVIDLCNNDIEELTNISGSGAVETILLANNNISSLGENVLLDIISREQNGAASNETSEGTPTDSTIEQNQASALRTNLSSISSLSLVNNNISSFSELVKLCRFRNLQVLLLSGNPICDEHHYRLFLVWILPNLRILDGERVKAAERDAASELFGESLIRRTPAADTLLHGSSASKSVSKETRLMTNAVRKLTAKEKEELIAQLELTLSMEEMERISNALKNGYIE